MESRTLQIVLHSAKDLFNVKNFGTMNPYAKMWIAGGGVESPAYTTNVATEAGTCPVWEYSMQFKVNPTKNNYVLFCEIQHDGTLFNRMIGEVQIPLKDLLASSQKSRYPVKSISGKLQGVIILSHNFSEPPVDESQTKSGTSKKDGTGSGTKKKGNSSTSKKDSIETRPAKKVEAKKKDGMMKKIAKNVGIEVGTQAVLIAATAGIVYALGDQDDPEVEVEVENDVEDQVDEDEDGLEDDGDDYDEDDDEY